MNQIDKIRKNMQTILILSRGLDGRRYSQIASAIHATGQMLTSIEAILQVASANHEAKKTLEDQLQIALEKQEQTIKELEALKKPQRQRKPKITKEPETSEEISEGEEE